MIWPINKKTVQLQWRYECIYCSLCHIGQSALCALNVIYTSLFRKVLCNRKTLRLKQQIKCWVNSRLKILQCVVITCEWNWERLKFRFPSRLPEQMLCLNEYLQWTRVRLLCHSLFEVIVITLPRHNYVTCILIMLSVIYDCSAQNPYSINVPMTVSQLVIYTLISWKFS